MLTCFEAQAPSIMGTGSKNDKTKTDQEDATCEKNLQLGELSQRQTSKDLIFFAGTDKAHV